MTSVRTPPKDLDLDLFDSNNKSKELLALAKELNFIENDYNPSLHQLRKMFYKHHAFDVKTKLDRLEARYNVKIIPYFIYQIMLKK